MKISTETQLIIAGGVVAVIAVYLLADKAGAAVVKTVDVAGGVLTGKNAITAAARTDAYAGAGILGTLGAGFDNLTGGVLSRAGEWLGSTVYDATHPVKNTGGATGFW